MPDFRPGPLFASARYSVVRREQSGAFHLHRGLVRFPGLPPASDPEEQVVVQLKSIAYELQSPIPGEDYAAYIDRRRAELRREAELLACYHEATAHSPQVFDLLVGRNDVDPQLKAYGRADDEPCLVLEHILGTPLSGFQQTLSQEETLILAEKLLMILRVFHTPSQLTGERRYFVTLTPEDILVDRQTFDCWFGNLWKLRTNKEISTVAIPCEAASWAFVSPAIAHRLKPTPVVNPVQPPGLKGDDLDLYSVGAILYFLLAGAPDLSQEAPGFLTPQRLEQLQQQRNLRSEVTSFIGRLVNHDFHSAQSALNALCDVRHKPHHPAYLPPPPPSRHGGSDREEKLLTPGTVVANRYEIEALVFKGGQGVVYLCRDRQTRCRVVLKMLRYSQDHQQGKPLESFVQEQRAQCLEEARLAVRMHNRISSVPQLLDVAFTTHPDERLRSHPDPQLSGETEPVLVFEFIAGFPLSKSNQQDEPNVLEFIRSIASLLARIHEPQNDLSYLYIDWKPENIVYHPETGNFTIVDLGSIARFVKGQGQYTSVASTNPYCGPEEYVAPNKINQRLTPAYDVHGLGAVAWQLSVRLSPDDLADLADKTFAVYRQAQSLSQPLLEVGRVPAAHQQLRSLLERCLQVNPLHRFQSATELAEAAQAALGRLHRFPPECARGIGGTSQIGMQVELKCQMSFDLFSEKVIICRGLQPPPDHRTGVVREHQLAGQSAGGELRWNDPVDPSWSTIHYAAFAVGYNGLVSAPARCAIQLAPPPRLLQAAPQETAVELRWETPEVVLRNGGQIVVERLAGTWQQVYAGTDSRFVDSQLDATHSYRYRLISRLPYGDSQPTETAVQPWPKLLHFDKLEAIAGDGQVLLRWHMPTGASAHEIVFLRSQAPLDLDDLDAPHKRARFDPIRLQLDDRLNVVGAEPNPSVKWEHLPDGRQRAEWVDSTVIPGVRYFYTPVLAYRGKPDPWSEPAVEAKAYREAAALASVALPGAVRLTWELPDRVDEVVIERLDAARHTAQTWTLPTTAQALLDHHLPAGQVVHRVRLRFGQVLSQGREVSSLVPDAQLRLPPLLVLPGDRCLKISGQRNETLNGVLEVEVDSEVQRFDLSPLPTARRWQQIVQVPPWRPASVRLSSHQGQALGNASAMAYAELSQLQAQDSGDFIEVAWIAPAGCEKVLLVVPEAGIRHVVRAAQQGARLGPVEPGVCQVFGHTLSALGDLSPGIAVWVEVPALASKQEQHA